MKTKLVYVLTCAPEANYIEQALMSVWSARHWNPDAHIVLITDNLTDQLFVGKRAEILDYISEKIVVPFEDNSLSMVYRSRWLKTSVRQLIKGDFLFIDCDTIVCKSLAEVDSFDCEVGAVYESHLPISDWHPDLLTTAGKACSIIDLDLPHEPEYFSSGVLYVKDMDKTHQLYNYWHQYWLKSEKKGCGIDQPSLAKANREIGYVIKRMPDTYNCILFTRVPFYENAHILHIASYRNPSWLFEANCLKYVRKHGLTEDLKQVIIRPCTTFFPCDYNILHSTLCQRVKWTCAYSRSASTYRRINKNFQFNALWTMLRRRIHVLRHKKQILNNIVKYK